MNIEDKLLTKIENLILDTSLTPAKSNRMALDLIKQYGLEERIKENEMYMQESNRHYYPSSPNDPYIPLVQFHERIAELHNT